MADQPFQPGDVVQLKSGGPKFTVKTAGAETIICYWHNIVTGKIEETGIPTIVLKLADEHKKNQEHDQLNDEHFEQYA